MSWKISSPQMLHIFCLPTGLELYPRILLHAENFQCHQMSPLKHISIDPGDAHSPLAHAALRGPETVCLKCGGCAEEMKYFRYPWAFFIALLHP